MGGYLFAHFIGEQPDGEQIYFSVSRDGLHWTDLNGGLPVLRSQIGEKGVRDPFLVRDEEKGKVYLIATDLCIGSGTSWVDSQSVGSRAIIVWESEDLVHWSEARSVRVGVEGAGCVWAPESIYDRDQGAFFVFWASMIKLEGDASPKQRIYGAYTKDFCTFTEPQVYLEAENHVIDMNIVEDNGWYYRFVKDETTKKVRADKVKRLWDETAVPIASQALDTLFGVEGPEAYRLPDGRWCLIVDQFGSGKGYLPLLCKNLDTGAFTVAPNDAYHFGQTKKRHGGILPVTEQELVRLEETLSGRKNG